MKKRQSKNFWRQLKTDKILGLSITCLVLIMLVAVFGSFIANNKALITVQEGKWSFPIFKSNQMVQDDKRRTFDFKLMPFIPMSSTEISREAESYAPPGSKFKIENKTYTHFLGTDNLGRDVAAGLVSGCQRSLSIAWVTCLIALFIGGIIGMLAGYWGDRSLKVVWWQVFLGLVLFFYVIFLMTNGLLSSLWMITIIFAFLVFVYFLKKDKAKFRLPVDSIALRSIEIIRSIPALILIMAFSNILSKEDSIWPISLLLGLVTWPTYARLIRGEVIKRKANDFVVSARVGGIRPLRIMSGYLLPETMGPLIVQFAFHLAQIILLESALSFLNIGLPADAVSWGSMLAMARFNYQAWWLALFPGLAIFVTVLVLYTVGTRILQYSRDEY